jgi:hypothetical protein
MAFLRDFHNKTILMRVGDWIIVTYGLIAGIAFFVGFTTMTWYMAMVGSDPASSPRTTSSSSCRRSSWSRG